MSIDRRSFLKNGAVLTITVANRKLGQLFAQVSPEYPEGPGFETWKNWHAGDNSGPLALVDSAILSFNTPPLAFQGEPIRN
jgi:hypothetical protein